MTAPLTPREALLARLRHMAKLLGIGAYDIPALLNEAADEIEHLTAAPPAPCAWQGIETAPRDGTIISVWHHVWKCPISARYIEGRRSDCKWVEATITTEWPDDAFTHWQPLPPAPAALPSERKDSQP